MRTTIDIAEHLLVAAKQLAVTRRESLTAIVEDSLRAYLAEARKRRLEVQPSRTPLPVNTRSRLARGMDLDDTSKLLEIE